MIPGIDDRSTVASNSDSVMGGLGEDTFLKLMVAQMQYQNPMEPSDPSAMLQQTSIMTQVEAMRDVLELQQQLIGFQEVTLASGMVGQTVVAETTEGTVQGEVTAVRFTSEGPLLTVDGKEISLGDTREVVSAETPPRTSTATSDDEDSDVTDVADVTDVTDTTDGADAVVPPASSTTTGATPSTAVPEVEVPSAGVVPPTGTSTSSEDPGEDATDPTAPSPRVLTGPDGVVADGATAAAGVAGASAASWRSVASATIGDRLRPDASAAAAPADRVRAGMRNAWL